ncbi:MAG: helix-turn-helix transcriptional regulator, partial [Treponema sp.]|nr:helix-turn-helix transcriptional regulator [Candidatus Treponema equifaecale]
VTNVMKQKKITQEKLCNDTGISVNTLRGSISKEVLPRVDLAKQIADYLEVSLDFLITGVESDVYRNKYEELKAAIRNDLEKL